MGQIEILAPAGSLRSLYGALKMGADAVYTGTSRFGARAFAENPTVDELTHALTYAHLRGKKIYLTVNTLLNDRELEDELFPLVAPLYEAGLDACIVQDLGVLSFLHENFPDMDLHASTQMTIFSGDEANLFKRYGVTRYVPARELSMEEIREARKLTDMEIEVFVHGALCYCYSGQCLMSEVIGGRSGNRGMCAQPCRLPYHTSLGNGYVLNTKDICTLFKIPELVEAGIDSFKIEGRMKKREYSAYVAHLYRKYVSFYEEEGGDAFDELVQNRDSVLWKDYKKSQDLFNRGGFSDSFLFEKEKSRMVCLTKNGHFGTLVGEVVKCSKGQVQFVANEQIRYQDVLEFREKDETTAYEYTVKNEAHKGEVVTANVKKGSHIYPGQKVYRRKNASLFAEISEQIECVDDRYPIRGSFAGQIGEPVTFTIEGNGVSAQVTGDILQQAAKRPVNEEDIKKNLAALGTTSYYFEELTVSIPPDVFLPIGGVKKLRREAIAKWEKKAGGTRNAVTKKTHSFKNSCNDSLERGENWIGVASMKQLTTAVEECTEDTMYIFKLVDFPAKCWEEAAKILSGERFAIEFPRILRGKGRNSFEKNWEQYGSVFREICPEAIVVNSHRSLLYAEKYFEGITWYADENLYRKNKRAEEVYHDFGLVPAKKRNYGRTAVMVTEGCVCSSMGHCGTGEKRVSLRGPKGDEFVAVMHCEYCFNTIYTKEPVCSEPGDTVRLDFTWESGDEVRKVMREWNL